MRSLAPQMAGAGIAAAAQIGLDTLDERLTHTLRSAGAMFLPRTLVGAWERRP